MKVKLSRGYGMGGPIEEIEIPANMCVYLQEYDGSEYFIYSEKPIYNEKNKEISGRMNKEICK